MDVSKCSGSICSYKGRVKQGVVFYIYILKMILCTAALGVSLSAYLKRNPANFTHKAWFMCKPHKPGFFFIFFFIFQSN